MTSSKSTKRALLTSALAILACVAMLIGTTFAWFTDTASTSVNKITSGKLDVALEKFENGAWSSAEGDTLSFLQKQEDGTVKQNAGILWEPGATYELPQLRIVNNGDLAFKYTVKITGIQGAAELLKAIDFTVKIGDAAPVALENWEGVLLPEGATPIDPEKEAVWHTGGITISGTMKPEAGNEYQELTLEGISITVYATQYTYEYDSSNNQYDKDAPVVYPAGLTTESFGNATAVLYSKTWGGFSIGTATSAEDIAKYPAVIAFEKDGELVYAADTRVAIESGASVIYCKENATVPAKYAHINVLRDLTVYANGADFKGSDLSIHAGGESYVAPENNETTVNIYNAKNLVVWGEPQAAGRVWNVNFYDCTNEGYNFFMYRGEGDRTDTFHLTMTNCFATGYHDSTVHATADGSIVIKNCTFVNNCAPVNIAHKQAGTLTVTVEGSQFINCGKVDPTNDYFAPVRFVNNSAVGTLNVTLKNNNFTDTIGTNGDILLGDYRTGKASHKITATITTNSTVLVKSSVDAAYDYAGGTIVTADN